MCKIDCSGGCPECAPDEHAAGEALDWLQRAGFTCDESMFFAVASSIGKEMRRIGTCGITGTPFEGY